MSAESKRDVILEVENLSIEFPRPKGPPSRVVDGISFKLHRGETLGVVGESGSGKTMTSLAVMGIVPSPGRVVEGSIKVLGKDITHAPEEGLRALRGKVMGMVFQDPMSGFNPVRTIGSQLTESILRHTDASKDEAWQRAGEALKAVGIPSPFERLEAYPHQLSGGLRQRCMIALAMINQPPLILADEPTTALDATIQLQILELMRARLSDAAMIMVTHDLGVAAEICDHVAVMYQGVLRELGSIHQVLTAPQHDYTKKLLSLVPRFEGRRRHSSATSERLLEAKDMRVTFKVRGRNLHAVDGIDISVHRGETVGVVGESGSGKSTLALALMRVHEPESGSILFEGNDITHLPGKQLRAVRARMQMVFQDPYASLDPRWTVKRIIAEPLRAHGWKDEKKIKERVEALMDQVDLPREWMDRLPSQFSGGQRQRIAIARALALNPDLLIADEPVSALDVSIQAQIVKLLDQIQRDLGIAYLVIAHDLPLVYQITDRVVVMYLGKVVEEGPTQDVIENPQHPYTTALLSAAPVPDPGRTNHIVLRGEPPSPIKPPSGCRFHTRCPIAEPRCSQEVPPLSEVPGFPGRRVACFYPGQLRADSVVVGEQTKADAGDAGAADNNALSSAAGSG